ncbi:hypothetical protein PR202_gb03818 [Eleusine coracana subsp. coracana]|uniref:Uncharacterized protein n=1 Tax=Eleusine coracana subsp. coracana TaxID=191504 RepID=A0AAV5E2W9_ELECO|nr:hypothetical protein PR202_gb03818 [Eleusine coracana subsp. coracana]
MQQSTSRKLCLHGLLKPAPPLLWVPSCSRTTTGCCSRDPRFCHDERFFQFQITASRRHYCRMQITKSSVADEVTSAEEGVQHVAAPQLFSCARALASVATQKPPPVFQAHSQRFIQDYGFVSAANHEVSEDDPSHLPIRHVESMDEA